MLHAFVFMFIVGSILWRTTFYLFRYVFADSAYLQADIFAHASLETRWSSIRLDIGHLWITILKPCPSVFIGLSFSLLLVDSITWIWFDQIHPLYLWLHVWCLYSMNLHQGFKSFTASNSLLLAHKLWPASLSMLKKNLYRMLPTCFIEGMVWTIGWWAMD